MRSLELLQILARIVGNQRGRSFQIRRGIQGWRILGRLVDSLAGSLAEDIAAGFLADTVDRLVVARTADRLAEVVVERTADRLAEVAVERTAENFLVVEFDYARFAFLAIEAVTVVRQDDLVIETEVDFPCFRLETEFGSADASRDL